MKKKISTEEFEKLEHKIWLEFLENATQLDIYKSVITSNFDGNSFLCNWIKDNPKIDKAIILVVYWMSAPRWKKKFLNREDYLEKEGYGIDGFDFVEEIEKKYIAGFYKGNEIIFNPKSDVEAYDWTSDYLDEIVVREIPEIMFKPTEGKIELKEYPEDFDEGLPISPINYAQKVYDIFDEYDVE
ncbi:DUF4274 domain-containing protein [Aquimarina longa]|uniref:DUF4274 domain-containing protein n=1 Tax=Aquimarina longa TaxID=1080221 RepID=UPI000780D89C|nr:DUF4274 domain-containing protein [Aquimarina longa]